MDNLILLGIAFLAAAAAGLVNAVAGGGTLVSFPVLMALGLPPVTANVTNTLGLCPGYIGGICAQRKELPGRTKRLMLLLPAGIAGGAAGAYILIGTGEGSFRALVPWLILGASLLLALQAPVRRWLLSRTVKSPGAVAGLAGVAAAPLLLFVAAIYGGYFGAGVSVIVIAILGLVYDDTLTSLNVLKLALSFAINAAAAVYFIFSGVAAWPFVIAMAAGSVLGGLAGGSVVEKVRPDTLRYLIVAAGLILAAVYFVTG